MKCSRRFIFTLFIIFIAVVPFAYSLQPKADIIPASSCSGENTILKLSNETNAHAALYDGTNYDYALCYGSSGIHTCTGSNIVLRLSSETNAHAEVFSESSIYEFKACFGELSCGYVSYFGGISGGCLGESKCLAKLSSLRNAHISSCDSNYPIVICCNEGGVPPPTAAGPTGGGTPGTLVPTVPSDSITADSPDPDGDGITNDQDGDDNGDGVSDVDEDHESCSSLAGVLCEGECGVSSYFSSRSTEINCCVSDTGGATCTSSFYVPVLNMPVKFEKTCFEEQTQVRVVNSDTGELVSDEDLIALGLDPTNGNPYRDTQDYSCSNFAIGEEGQPVPFYSLFGLLSMSGVLVLFYFIKGKRNI